jgi:citrate lyase beta subunit
VVTAILAETGQVVAAGQPIARIAQPGAREVLIHVPESRIAGLRVGGAAQKRVLVGIDPTMPIHAKNTVGLRTDSTFGDIGKTTIHPAQIPVIEALYRLSRNDYETVAVLAPDAAAVFKLHDTFCEPATHRRWAAGVLERARVFGVAG